MSSITISLIVLSCVFGGALLGFLLHAVLPKHHLSSETKDIVKLGMGLVGTMAALVLGLLVASAKGSYDAQSAELSPLHGVSIRFGLKRALLKRRRRLPAAKFFTRRCKGSRRRTTPSARSRARRQVSLWISEKPAG